MDKTAAYVRQTDIDKLRYKELILKFTETQGYITRKDAAELLKLTPMQAYRVLQKLAAAGELQLQGKGKYAKYVRKQ